MPEELETPLKTADDSALETMSGLHSRYEFRGIIGRGGMGVVFRARDLQLDRDVAIKVLSFEGSKDSKVQERFLKEAKTLVLLAYFYCRRLELKLERPALFKVCNALRTVDLALSPDAEAEDLPLSSQISAQAWSRVRDQLFKIMLTSFPGYFLVYESGSLEPLEQTDHWPENGAVEFYPEKILRRFETYRSECSRIDQATLTILRWCYSQDRHSISPSMFENEVDNANAQEEAIAFLDRMYEICEEEASEGKKKAHRKWCQLYWEANGCPDRRLRNELQKQMLSLQSVWGRPAQLV